MFFWWILLVGMGINPLAPPPGLQTPAWAKQPVQSITLPAHINGN